jgi:hypothetical protein
MNDAAARWLPPALEATITKGGGVGATVILRAAALLRTRGNAALADVEDARLEAAFLDTVAAFRDPSSAERRALDPALRESAALSRGCLDASLAALLDGFGEREVRSVIASARRLRSRRLAPVGGGDGDRERSALPPHLIVLAGSLPGVALAPLLATLAARRPAILKSSSREPFFAPAFAAALAAREPAIGDALAAVVWRGGDLDVETRIFAEVDRVVAYGGALALADLRRRAPEQLIAFGPKASVAIVAGSTEGDSLAHVAEAFARDVALFEQRGCLSLQAIYTVGDAGALAAALASALERAARLWPPLPLSPSEAGALRSMREEAAFLGCDIAAVALDRATVIVDPRALFLPSPGRRTVRVHPAANVDAALAILRPHALRLQGVAVAGEREARKVEEQLAALGVSYVCAPGRLQSPGASWSNGGIDLVRELAAHDSD